MNTTPINNANQDNVWHTRYSTEGAIWGNSPSNAARYLVRQLQNNSNIMEVGAGYLRDSRYFVENGHSVTAIEKAAAAGSILPPGVIDQINSGRINFTLSDFTRVALSAKSQDAFFSHRMLHLLNNGAVDAFANAAGKVLKPEGLLLITARNFKDFKDEEMRWIDQNEGIAEYRTDLDRFKDREGQILHFWSENRLKSLFEEHFENIEVVDSEEPEAIANLDKDGKPVMTQYASIRGTRKPRQILRPVR